MKFSTKLAATALALTVSTASFAEDKAPNPADLTAANTFGAIQVGGDKDNKFVGGMFGIAGQYSEGNIFLGMVEHRGSTDADNLYTRARYFQILDTEVNLFPQVGFSIDYNKAYGPKEAGGDIDTVALGVIGKLDTGMDWLTLYPNVGAVEVKFDGVKSRGYIANLFASIYMGDDGSYLMLQPQSTITKDINIYKFEVAYGAPMNDKGTLWWEAKAGYTKTELDSKYLEGKHKDSNTEVLLGLYYYF